LPQVFAASHTPGAGLPFVSQMPLAQEALPVAPEALALQGLLVSTRQLELQPSPLVVLPSSQPSPASSLPLPQVLAGSHRPGAGFPTASQTPLEQEALPVRPAALALQGLAFSMRQVELQPSPLLVLPSSQPSPASSLPLPHVLAASHTPGAGLP